MQKLLTFFQQKYYIYAAFNDQSFNDELTNKIISFESLGTLPSCTGIIKDFVWIFQGSAADYEQAIRAVKEAWQIWADVSYLFIVSLLLI